MKRKMTPHHPGEFAIIADIRRAHRPGPRVKIGIGDDCAALDVRGDKLCLVTTDMLLEGTHFLLARTALPRSAARLGIKVPRATVVQVGWKAITCSVSDIAAMGCVPTAAVVSVGFSADTCMARARGFLRGLSGACKRYGVELVGGDITSWDQPMAVSVTMLGRDAGLKPLTRSGARVGDRILVTGALGGSLLGRHLTFEPRLKEALVLNRCFAIHSMIDISDGLSSDLHHIAEESKVGAVVWAERVPISSACRRLAAKTGKTPLEHALSDGEDYELLFTASPGVAKRLIAEQPLGVPVTEIGETVAERGVWLRAADGTRRPLKPSGYEHLR
jgi:thiamine-monophosphate kinase